MTRETLAAAVMVWLIGALADWCAGWVARGNQNRAWYRMYRSGFRTSFRSWEGWRDAEQVRQGHQGEGGPAGP